MAFAASSRRMPTAYVIHTYGDATRTYQEGELTTWEQLTDVNCTSVTTLSSNSSGTTLNVVSTTPFVGCELNRSTVSVDGQVLTITGIGAGTLSVSAISGTITSGTAVMAGFVLECYDDGDTPYNDNLQGTDIDAIHAGIYGATTNSSYFRVIRAADGYRGTKESGVRFAASNKIAIFNIGETYFGLYDIATKLTSSTTGARYTICLSANYAKVVGCYVYDCSNSYTNGSIVGIGSMLVAVPNSIIANCVVDNVQGSGSGQGSGIFLGTIFSTNVSNVYNSIIINSECGIYIATAFASDSATVNSKNCIIQDNTSNIITTGAGSETHNQTTNVTSGVIFNADGYHLDPSATVAIDQGTDLSSDPTFAFDDDIDGGTRSGTWDIGCDEYVPPPPRPPCVLRNNITLRSGSKTIIRVD